MKNQIGEGTIRVLGTITMYKATGITTQQLVDILEIPKHVVGNSLEVLKKHEKIKKGGHTGNVWWWIPFDAPLLADKQTSRRVRASKVKTQTARTTHLTDPVKIPWTTLAKPGITPSKTYTNATSKELLHSSPMSSTRADADDNLKYGSIVNGHRVPYAPPISQCVGAIGGSVYAPSRMQQ